MKVTAGGIIFRDRSGAEVLLLKKIRRKSVEWVAPKGRIEKGETPEKAALREVSEEAGIDRVQLHGRVGIQTFQYKNNSDRPKTKIVHWFLMLAASDVALSPDLDEGFLEARWIEYQNARSIVHSEFVSFLDRAYQLLKSGSQENSLQ